MLSLSSLLAMLHFAGGMLALIGLMQDKKIKLSSRARVIMALSTFTFIIATFISVYSEINLIFKAPVIVFYAMLSLNSARLARNKYPNNAQGIIFLRDLVLLSASVAAVTLLAGSRISTQSLLIFISLASFVYLIMLIISAARLLSRRPNATRTDYPTVSILIPARNEDHALHECLSSLLQITYPKLEIIVLDDCSQDRTSEVVAKFARDGIRFIQGDSPQSGWTGKNNALRKLVEEASGSYLLICDVDVHLSPDSLQELISYMLDKKKQMISVIPSKRSRDFMANLVIGEHESKTLLSGVLPSALQTAGRVCYLIQVSHLKSLGGVEKYKSSAMPETALASKSGELHELLLGRNFGITTRKRLSSINSSISRLAYPLNYRSLTLISTHIIWCLLVAAAIADLAHGSIYAGVLIINLLAVHTIKLVVLDYKNTWLFPLSWIISYLNNVGLGIISIFKYEFGTVIWKQRNVCYPVLNSISHLPKLDD